MPVPAISAKNWNRTSIIAHFVTGTDLSMIDGMSFADQVEIVVGKNHVFTEEAVELENDDDSYIHRDFRRRPDDPYVVQYSVNGEGEHRARMSDDLIDAVNGQARAERPSMPIEKLSFDDTLGIILDSAERYYRTMNLEVREKPPEEAA